MKTFPHEKQNVVGQVCEPKITLPLTIFCDCRTTSQTHNDSLLGLILRLNSLPSSLLRMSALNAK